MFNKELGIYVINIPFNDGETSEYALIRVQAMMSYARVFVTYGRFIALNDIRRLFDLDAIRAECELCFGPDPEKPIAYETEPYEEGIKLTIRNIIDLRQYYEV